MVHSRKVSRKLKTEKRLIANKPSKYNEPYSLDPSLINSTQLMGQNEAVHSTTTPISLTPNSESELANKDPAKRLERLLKKREELLRQTLIEVGLSRLFFCCMFDFITGFASISFK